MGDACPPAWASGPRRSTAAREILVVTSTFGDGGPPDDAAEFWGRISADDAPSLVGARFAVLGYGDWG